MHCPLSQRSSEPAIIDGKTTYSYKACDELASGIACDLQKKGIGPRSVVAFVAKSDLPTILTFFALFRLQAIAAPLSHRLPAIKPYLARLPNPHFITPALSKTQEASFDLDLSQTATYLFTSGSTNSPKIAMHTLSNHIYSALGVNSYFNLKQGDTWQLTLPLHHVGGLAILFRVILAGAAVSLDGPATHASWVPTQAERALKSCPSYKAILIGGAPLSMQLALKCSSHFPIFPSYGLTEMSSTVIIKNTILPYRRARIVDGELQVAGPTLFQGYLGEKRTSSWFKTGDLASPDFKIIGRKDRLFISGGENIQPEEIETALLSLPGITQAVVVPVTDQEFGQRPVAFIDNINVSKNQLEDLLPRFKLPIAYLPLPKQTGKPDLMALAAKANALIRR